jgi:hypothetical protein
MLRTVEQAKKPRLMSIPNEGLAIDHSRAEERSSIVDRRYYTTEIEKK